MNSKRTKRWRAIGHLSLLWGILLCLSVAGGLLASPTTLTPEAVKLSELRGVSGADFNHDGSRVLVRSGRQGVEIWDVSAGTRVAGDDLKLNVGGTSGYFMSPDAKRFLVRLEDVGHYRVFDTATAKAVSPILDVSPENDDVGTLALFSPDGNTVLFFGAREVVVFDVPSGKRAATLPLPGRANEQERRSAAFPAGGAHCFVTDGGGTVTRYDAKEWKPVGKPIKHPPADSPDIFGFNISEDGKWLATFDTPFENGDKSHLQVWDVAANKPLGKPVVSVNCVPGRFLGSNRILVSPCRGESNVRDLPSMKIVYSLRSHVDIDERTQEVSPNGKWILAWGPDLILDLVNAASGKLEAHKPGSAQISKVMIAPDSSASYVVYDNSAFPDEDHHDYYVVKMSLPDLKITDSLRFAEPVSASLSLNGQRLMVLQKADQGRLLFYDATDLKPLQ
jgi:WD40 repeat protein